MSQSTKYTPYFGQHHRYIKWRARARVDMTDFTGLTSCSSTARHSKNTIQWPQCKIGASFSCLPSRIRVMSEVQIVLLRTRGVQLIRACARSTKFSVSCDFAEMNMFRRRTPARVALLAAMTCQEKRFFYYSNS